MDRQARRGNLHSNKYDIDICAKQRQVKGTVMLERKTPPHSIMEGFLEEVTFKVAVSRKVKSLADQSKQWADNPGTE